MSQPCREVVGVVRLARAVVAARAQRGPPDAVLRAVRTDSTRPSDIPRDGPRRSRRRRSAPDGRARAARDPVVERSTRLRAHPPVPGPHRSTAPLVAARRDALLGVQRHRARHRDDRVVRRDLVRRDTTHAGDGHPPRSVGGWAVARLVVGDALRRTVVGLAFGVTAAFAGPLVAACCFRRRRAIRRSSRPWRGPRGCDPRG